MKLSKYHIPETLFYLQFIFVLISCKDFGDIKIESDAKIKVPLAFGEYKVEDLFYEYDDTAVIDHGVFYQLRDTVKLKTAFQIENAKRTGFQFHSINYLPIHIDLTILPFDTITNGVGKASETVRMVESANYNDQLEVLTPVYSNHIFWIENDEISYSEAGGAIVQLDFIWPRNKVSVPVDGEIPAFSLNIVFLIEY